MCGRCSFEREKSWTGEVEEFGEFAHSKRGKFKKNHPYLVQVKFDFKV